MTERYLKAEKCSLKKNATQRTVRGSGSRGPLTEMAGRWWSSQNDFRVVLWEQQVTLVCPPRVLTSIHENKMGAC